MTTQEQQVVDLMKPRYKVTALYPNCYFEVGNILYQHGNEGGFDSGIYYDLCQEFTHPVKVWLPGVVENYPHLFKPLQWWEERELSEMPEYVRDKSAIPQNVLKVTYQKGIETENGLQYDRMLSDGPFNYAIVKNVMCFFEPATETDYLNHITQNK